MSDILEQIRAIKPQYKDVPDDELIPLLHQRYAPNAPIGSIYKNLGVDDPNADGDIVRGAKDTFRQIPQLGYGMLAAGGATAEHLVGDGGIATGIKNAGLKGYQAASDDMAKDSKDSDSLTYSWDKAKQGDLGALADWLQYGIGYAGGQGLQMLATAGIGSAVAKAGAGTIAKELAEKMVTAEVGKIAASEGARALTADAIQAAAVANVTDKIAKIGATSAMGAAAFGMEGGEIGGDMVSQAQKEGRTLTGEDLAKGFGATLGAGTLEFVGDKFGLDVLTGKSGLFKMGDAIPGFKGKAARGLLAGAAAAPAEGGTEYGQTLIEEYGKGNDPFSEESKQQAFDAAGLGALGGGAMGVGGGMLSKARQAPPVDDTLDVTDIAQAGSVDEAIQAAGQSVSRPINYQATIDAQFAQSGIGDGDLRTVNAWEKPGYWEKPNTESVQRQAEANRAFYDREQAGLQQKQNELLSMEMKPDATPDQVKQYRKARAEIEQQKRIKADQFRSALGFNVVPNRAGQLDNSMGAKFGGLLSQVRPMDPEALAERQAIQGESSLPADRYDGSIPYNESPGMGDEIQSEWDAVNSLNATPETNQSTLRKQLLNARQDQPTTTTQATQQEDEATPSVPPAQSGVSSEADATASGFVATHTTSDGTPVIATDEPNIWFDGKGEIEDEYAAPIKGVSNANDNGGSGSETNPTAAAGNQTVAGESSANGVTTKRPDAGLTDGGTTGNANGVPGSADQPNNIVDRGTLNDESQNAATQESATEETVVNEQPSANQTSTVPLDAGTNPSGNEAPAGTGGQSAGVSDTQTERQLKVKITRAKNKLKNSNGNLEEKIQLKAEVKKAEKDLRDHRLTQFDEPVKQSSSTQATNDATPAENSESQLNKYQASEPENDKGFKKFLGLHSDEFIDVDGHKETMTYAKALSDVRKKIADYQSFIDCMKG
ncbi:hypothetical protein CCP3SC15_2260001 [Gammaproteobacteria bacterium]